MNRTQFALSLAVMGLMSLVGSFVAVYALQGAPVQAQKEEAAEVVKGGGFVLVDKKGNPRASLDIGDDNEVRFTLIDSEGKGRVQLNSGGERAYIALLDRSQQIRYLVGQDDSMVMETYLDAKGKNRMISQFKDGGQSLFSFNSEAGENLMSLMAGPKDASTLLLKDPTGKNGVTVFAKDDQATMQLDCGGGSILSAVLGDGRPVFALSKADKLRLRAMLGEDGTPEFIFLNDKKEATWRAGK
ncbi:MAG: hypothetical protein H6840_09810 [Planctomycetes bacterium]|nr:hypothetical protein [Planctomycetota bacterium]